MSPPLQLGPNRRANDVALKGHDIPPASQDAGNSTIYWYKLNAAPPPRLARPYEPEAVIDYINRLRASRRSET